MKVEDAGFDWKILGPDVHEEEYVAHTCDQDAYAYRCPTKLFHPQWSVPWALAPSGPATPCGLCRVGAFANALVTRTMFEDGKVNDHVW